jgi:hypothetical protein
MKKLTLFSISILINTVSICQLNYIKGKSDGDQADFHDKLITGINKKAPSTYGNSLGNHGNLKNLQSVVWSNDFSNSGQWTKTHASGTTGNWVVGTTPPSGPYAIAAIQSPTAGNGYGLFDSDLICSGNQDAYLTNASSINCIGHPNIVLKFYQYYRRYVDSTFVKVSMNNFTTFTKYTINQSLSVNSATSNPNLVSIDISSVAGNQANVKIRFEFFSPSSMGSQAGCGYAWMVDDVSIEDFYYNDAEAKCIFTLGEIPAGYPHQVTAIIRNPGVNSLSNFNVTLTVTGANTFSNIKTITSLASGSETTVTFDAYTCSNLGVNNVTVSVPTDQNNSNNAASYYQACTAATISYADTSQLTGGVGYGSGSGLILCKYYMSGLHSIQNVIFCVKNSTENVGQTVYGVILNSSGTIIGQSPNHIIQNSEIGTYVTLTLSQPPSFADAFYYAGIAQTTGTTAYSPLGTQAEIYHRPNAYFAAGISGGMPLEVTNNYVRLMIKAVISTGALNDIAITAILSPVHTSGCGLGNNEAITVRIKNFGILTATNFPVSYIIENGTPVTETVTTSIASLASYDYTFSSNINLSAYHFYHLTVFTSLTTDLFNLNDTIKYTITSGDRVATVNILTDSYGSETSWDMKNNAGEIVAYGGIDTVYSNNTFYSKNFCVISSDCYLFNIYDSYGDGILSPGGYEILYNNSYVGGNLMFSGLTESLNFIGEGCNDNDIEVLNVYTLGALPVPSGSPHFVSALVKNIGSVAHLVNVVLNITGANVFTDTVSVELNPLQETIVQFAGYTCTNTGLNNVIITVPGDDNNTNNFTSYYQMVNQQYFSYSDTSAISTGIGFGSDQGLLFNSYYMNGTNQVTGVRVNFSNNIASVGNTVYGVILDNNHNVICQSDDYIILMSDLGSLHTFSFTTSVTITNSFFYAGLAQTTGTNAYFPLGVQAEIPVTRDNTYFGSGINGENATAFTNFGRFMIDAVINYIPLYDTQNIFLNGGWNIFSTYIDPLQPDVEDVMSDIVQSLTIVKDGQGNVYWPANGVNTIGELVIGQGYQIRTTQVVTLQIIGSAIIPEITPIYLPQGWSIIGYLRQIPGNVCNMLSSIISNMILLKNYSGQIYWPNYNINNIGTMNPGFGYHIKMFASQTLTYPANNVTYFKELTNVPIPSHFTLDLNTGSNMTVCFPANSLVNSNGMTCINPCDEIGIFDENGNLVGSSVYTGGNIAVNVWGDDIFTSWKDGLYENEKLSIKIWHKETNEENQINVESWIEDGDNYITNGISIIGELCHSQQPILCQNYPNPFSNKTSIKFVIPQASNISISIYNSTGQFLEKLTEGKFGCGEYDFDFIPNENYPDGNYFYCISSELFSYTKCMTIQR